MDSFRDNVFYLLLWRAILATLIAIVLMVTRSFALGGAFLIGAHVALLFSVGLILWIRWVDDESLVRVRAWRMLMPSRRPAGPGGRRCACNYLKETGLRFAKAASAAAMALAAASLLATD